MRHFKFISAAIAMTLAAASISMTVFAEDNENVNNAVPDESANEVTEPITEAYTEEVTEGITEEVTNETTEEITEPSTEEDIEPVTVNVKTVCEHFVKSDVNGRVVVSVPKDVTANIKIVYDSPEYDAHSYYEADELAGNALYIFDLEGRDTTEDDYRNYTISVELTGGIYNLTSKAYTDTFNIPDGNDNPDSFRELCYNFKADGEASDNEWDVSVTGENTKDIAVHLDYVRLGDVNGNIKIDSSDASLVLIEYAIRITGGETSLTAKQCIAADVDKNNTIDSKDASKILIYYAESITGGNPSWD